MRYIKGSFLPLMKEKQKHQPHLDLAQIQADLDLWDKEIANTRLIYGVGRTPLDLFETEEKQALKPLPETRFDVPKWFRCIVRRDWRIMYDYSYYSVSYTLIGETVDVCVTSKAVRIFYDHQEIALHPKATKKWEYQRNTSHAPPFQEAVLTCNRDGLLMKAEEIGPHCHALVETILSNPLVDKLKAIRSLLKLALKYSKERLEKACERAVHYEMFRYVFVKNILENNLDQQSIHPEKTSTLPPAFKHARDPKEYRSQTPSENPGG